MQHDSLVVELFPKGIEGHSQGAIGAPAFTPPPIEPVCTPKQAIKCWVLLHIVLLYEIFFFDPKETPSGQRMQEARVQLPLGHFFCFSI